MVKNKLCVMGVYFGKLPNSFRLWLKSAKINKTIDFLVFTDQEITDRFDNVKVIPMTLAEMQKRASSVLEFEACLSTPYKCCDYKPLYGLIFADYVQEYDYWGHTDFDLIFGDLQHFFDKYDLYKYDRFLALGHLSMYRNTPEVNARYRCDGSWADYKTVFSSDTIFVFDELPGMTALYQKNNFPIFVGNVFADITPIYNRFRRSEAYYLDGSVGNVPHQTFYWENGKVYKASVIDSKIETEEFMYIHFQKRPNFEVTDDVLNGDAFYITNRGFIAKSSEVTKEDIDIMNPYPGRLKEKAEYFISRVKYYKKALKRRIKKIF